MDRPYKITGLQLRALCIKITLISVKSSMGLTLSDCKCIERLSTRLKMCFRLISCMMTWTSSLLRVRNYFCFVLGNGFIITLKLGPKITINLRLTMTINCREGCQVLSQITLRVMLKLSHYRSTIIIWALRRRLLRLLRKLQGACSRNKQFKLR